MQELAPRTTTTSQCASLTNRVPSQLFAGMPGSKFVIEIVAITMISAIAIGFGIQGAGMASGYVDPFLNAGAQDEAVYGHAAANMVHTGHWLTPVFLDRLMLNKTPLLLWSGATTMRAFGVSPTVLRLPVIGAAVLCCVLVYCWLRRSQPVLAASGGLLLLLSNAIFHSLARKFMTDILLTSLIVAAMFVLTADPALNRAKSAGLFGFFSGAAIMTKGAAGILPLLILIAYFLLLKAEFRPAPQRIVTAFAVAALFALPWHLYQFVVHRDWFLAEYVRFQLLGSGITSPSRYSAETNLGFYAQRLLAMDPVLLLTFCLALPGMAKAWRKSGDEQHVRALTAWSVCAFAVLLVFGTRVAYYLLPLLPAMAIVSVQFSPLFRGRAAIIAFGLLATIFGIKVSQATAVWGINYHRQSVPSAAALDQYSGSRRANELVIVSPDDEFYASLLDLPKIRYAYLGTLDATKTSDFFRALGVNVSTREFCELPALMPVYSKRLAAWRHPDTNVVGSIITGTEDAELAEMIRCSSDRDFFLPDTLRETAAGSGSLAHFATASQNGHFFLLSKKSIRRADNAHSPGALINARNVGSNISSIADF